MDESVVKKKIQAAYSAPQASETLIQRTILRAQAVTMGVEAQRELETAPAEKLGQLASRVLIGQLAAVSDLPKGIKPEHLAQQLEQEPAFQAALRGGNAAQRVKSGELMRQVIKQKPAAAQASPKPPVQVKKGPGMER